MANYILLLLNESGDDVGGELYSSVIPRQNDIICVDPNEDPEAVTLATAMLYYKVKNVRLDYKVNINNSKVKDQNKTDELLAVILTVTEVGFKS